MNSYEGIEILKKSREEKKKYYTKLLCELHTVTQHLGYTPDPQFYGALQWYEPQEGDNVVEASKTIDFEEHRIKKYSEYLCDLIYKDIDKISDTDLLNLIVFNKEHPGTEEYFQNIIYKSKEKCKECETPEEEKETKIVKTPLGQYIKEE